MIGRQKGVWYPDLVGVIRGYPKTLETFQKNQERCRAMVIKANAEGRAGTLNVPNGWAHRKQEVAEVREAARLKAIGVVRLMREDDMLEGEDPRGDTVINEALEIVLAKNDVGQHTYTVDNRLKAIKIVAEFTKTKPIVRTKAQVSVAEDYYAELAKRAEIRRLTPKE